QLRELTNKPIKYIIFSHGHFDHCFGFKPFLDEIKTKDLPRPQIIAHKNCINRFEKYRMLKEYHQWINRQQFSSVIGDEYLGPSALRILEPTIVLSDNEYSFQLGGFTFYLYHEYGETDDSLWLWFPEKEVIFSGDLIISSFPNVGNPYKVQRYPKQWAYAMDKMIEKDAKFLAPGHGQLIEGKARVRDILSTTSEALHFLHDEVIKRMNQGKWFEQIYHEMISIYPDKFRNHDYLSPIYGCYQFAIHAIYRLYHGWYDSGNPTDLFPAKSKDIARELLKISDARSFLERASSLTDNGNLQLALHIIEPVIKGIDINVSDNPKILLDALKLKISIFEKQLKFESSFISSNILRNGIMDLERKIKELQETE
ncbi:MAG: alkyl sulfatase dimerization domain-containing protein, partial [Candidatus Hodarchaeota archaeon]